MADLSGVSTKDLEYASRGQWDKVSTKGLEAMAAARGMSVQEQPSIMAPVPYSPIAETARAANAMMYGNSFLPILIVYEINN
jgi:hypothetical protein